MPIGKRATAELVGTFWLVFGGCGSAVLSAAFPNVCIGLLGRASDGCGRHSRVNACRDRRRTLLQPQGSRPALQVSRESRSPTALHSTVTFPPPRRKVLPLDSLAASDPFKAMPAGLSR